MCNEASDEECAYDAGLHIFSLIFLTVQAEVCLASGQNHMGETILWQLTLNVNNADLVKKP